MIICTDKDLEQFSTEHYTYINQIFGDEGVRERLSKKCTQKLNGIL